MKKLLIVLTVITLFSCGNQNKVKMENNVKIETKKTEIGTIEIVIFKTLPEYAKEEVINSAKAVMPVVEKLGGFLGRKMAISNDNQIWADVIFWKDMDAAQFAAQEVLKSETCGKFFATIDESSMKMLHLTPVIMTEPTNEEKVEVLELVLFKTKPQFTKDAIIKAGKSINSVLEKFDGFISRKLALTEDGEWMDLVYWTDLQKAKSASKAILNNEIAKEYFKMIDESTMQFMHLNVVIDTEKIKKI